MFGSPKLPAHIEPKTPEKSFTEEEMRIALIEMIDYMRKLSDEMEAESTSVGRKMELREALDEILEHYLIIRNKVENPS